MICGKIIYPSKTEAKEAMRGKFNFTRVGESKKKCGFVYYCKDCEGWHLATSGKKKKRNRKDKSETDTRHIDRLVIGRSQTKMIIHDPRTFKVK